MHDTEHSHTDATQPPLTLLRPEVRRRLQAHDREAEGYDQQKPAPRQDPDS